MNTYAVTVTLPDQAPDMISAIKLVRADYITARISLKDAKVKVVKGE